MSVDNENGVITKEKKSKKKKIVISAVSVSVPLILALLYMTNPSGIGLAPQTISVNDFPIEKFDQGYDILCNKYPDKSLACLIKNDGIVSLSLGNGIYIFQTLDYSLMKGFMSDIGDEEKSISYAFYADGSSVRVIDGEKYAMWLLTPVGKQISTSFQDF